MFILPADRMRAAGADAGGAAGAPLIAFEAGSGTRELIDGWFRASGRDISPVMQLGSIEAIKRMVRAGLGYSIVPRMAVAHHDDRQGYAFNR